MREIRVGLIGYGLGGSIFHAPLIAATQGLQLATVVTSRRDQVGKDFPGVQVVSTTPELLADPSIDLVIVVSPTPTHFAAAKAALEAGKHVVVDKPFVATVREADYLIALAEARGKSLSVFQNRRWDNDFLTVKQCIADGSLGTIYHFESRYDRFRPKLRGGWREIPQKGTGTLYDLGSHLIDQVLQLFGMPRAVQADAFSQRPDDRSGDYFHIILDYGRMRGILHATNLAAEPGARFAAHGDAGSFVKYGMDPQEDALKAGMRPGDPQWGEDKPADYGKLTTADEQRVIPTLVGGYEHYYAGIVAHLLDGAPRPVDPADSRDGLIIIEAVIRSAYERRAIAIV